jgi:hypothetical protein
MRPGNERVAGRPAWAPGVSETASQLEAFLFESIHSALQLTPPAEASEIYVVSLLVYDLDDDPRHPTVTVGYNSEPAVAHAMTKEPWPASSEAEARWNYAYFQQNQLGPIIGDPEQDSDGPALVETWAREYGWWFTDEDEEVDFAATLELGESITQGFVALLVKAVQRLHQSGEVERIFGRAIPVLIHELEYYEQIAKQNLEANPPGIADEFARWCMRE